MIHKNGIILQVGITIILKAGKMKELKHQQIYHIIEAQIKEGFWKPGNRIYSERQLAELHSVSRLTVKRALSDLISKGILEYKQGRQGTFVTERKLTEDQNENNRDMKFIGVAIDNQTPAYASHLLQGIHDALWDNGYHTIYCNTYHNSKVYDRIESLMDASIAGIIYSPVLGPDNIEVNNKILESIDDKKIPLVLVDRFIPNRLDNHVVVDNKSSFQEMTELLIKQGHERILYINGFEATSSNDRRKGFFNAFEKSGSDSSNALEIKLDELELNNTGHIPEKILEEVSSMGNFTAIIGLNQLLLEAGLTIARKLGINVVTATAVASSKEKTCDLAVVQPIYQVGREAAQLIVRKLKEKDLPVTQLTLKAHIQDNRNPE